MTERERLLELLKHNNCSSPMLCDPNCKYAELQRCYEERTADYLLANGVIVPPHKIGTPLYFLSGDLDECEIIRSSSWLYIVDSFGNITIEETMHDLKYKNNYEYVFGVTVFSTKEEAKKALEEMMKNDK